MLAQAPKNNKSTDIDKAALKKNLGNKRRNYCALFVIV